MAPKLRGCRRRRDHDRTFSAISRLNRCIIASARSPTRRCSSARRHPAARPAYAPGGPVVVVGGRGRCGFGRTRVAVVAMAPLVLGERHYRDHLSGSRRRRRRRGR
jgi:hypothetical protein